MKRQNRIAILWTLAIVASVLIGACSSTYEVNGTNVAGTWYNSTNGSTLKIDKKGKVTFSNGQ